MKSTTCSISAIDPANADSISGKMTAAALTILEMMAILNEKSVAVSGREQEQS